MSALALNGLDYWNRAEPVGKKTTLRVGGAARFYCEPENEARLIESCQYAYGNGLPVFILGRGSNLIVDDAGFNGLVIRLHAPYWQSLELTESGQIYARAGARLKALCGQAAKWGKVGFEFLEGIPGSLGGALKMNAGAFEGWMYEVVERLDAITFTGEPVSLEASAMEFGYRYCKSLENLIAVGALLRPKGSKDPESIQESMQRMTNARKLSQPKEPSAGCMFKNPKGGYAGALVDAAGLKGFQIGGARISEIHANFVVNTGTASSEDVFALVRFVHQKIFKEKGVWLEPEPLVLGNSWEKILDVAT